MLRFVLVAAASIGVIACCVNCGPQSDRRLGEPPSVGGDSATAVAKALAVVQGAAGPRARGYAVAGMVRDSAGIVVVVAPACDTTAAVDSVGRPFQRGCGGGDYTVRVPRDGEATIVARGQ